MSSEHDDNKIINLGSERAQRRSDATLWTPIDALRDTLKRVEAGELQPDMIYIAMSCKDGDGRSFPYVRAGTQDMESLGLLQQHLYFRSQP